MTITHNASLELDERRFANCSFIDDDDQPIRNAQNNYYRLLVGVNDADQDEQAYYSSPGCDFDSELQPFDDAGWSFNWVATVEGLPQ